MPGQTKDTTLFSLDTVRTYVKAGADAHDATLVRIADGVSERVDAYIRRPFVRREVVETRDGNGTRSLQLRHFPVQSVSRVRIRYTLVDAWTEIGSTEYVLDGFRGYVHLTMWGWPTVVLGCEVTYMAGFADQDSLDLPQDVVQAALDFVKFVYDRWKSDTVLLGSVNTQSGGSVVVIPALPKDLKDALEPYIKRRM